jgi:hypothetical protein
MGPVLTCRTPGNLQCGSGSLASESRGGGTARLITNDEYGGWRNFLLTHHDAFRERLLLSCRDDLLSYVSDPVMSEP